MPKYLILLIINMSIFWNCSHEKYGVFFNELPTPPTLTREGNIVQIRLENSIRHSGRSIYKLEATRENGTIQLRIFQKPSGIPFAHYQNDFTIDLQKYNLTTKSTFSIIWLDPDGKKTVLVTYNQ
jgi:hypothetical protein